RDFTRANRRDRRARLILDVEVCVLDKQLVSPVPSARWALRRALHAAGVHGVRLSPSPRARRSGTPVASASPDAGGGHCPDLRLRAIAHVRRKRAAFSAAIALGTKAPWCTKHHQRDGIQR